MDEVWYLGLGAKPSLSSLSFPLALEVGPSPPFSPFSCPFIPSFITSLPLEVGATAKSEFGAFYF